MPLSTPYHGQSGILVHGADGLGNSRFDSLSDEHLQAMKQFDGVQACDWLFEQCKARPQEIVVVTLGPLTNLAMAYRRHPTITGLVKRVVSMGGSFHGRGNKSPMGEANITNDPEAAQLVISQYPDTTLVPLDVTRQLSLEALIAHLDANHGATTAIKTCMRHYIDTLKGWGETAIAVHDSTAVMFVVR